MAEPEGVDGDFRRAFGSGARELVNDTARLRSMWDVEPALHFDPDERPPSRTDDPPSFADDPVPVLSAAETCDPTRLTVRVLTAAMRGGVLSPSNVLAAFRGRIESFDGNLNAFLSLVAPGTETAVSGSGLLYGVPFAVKDLIETAGMATTAGSRQLLDHVPGADAEVVRLLRGSGSILLGKLNTHEFAAGATGDNPHFGVVRNPWDPSRLAGGSSSGSAAAVAARLVPFALGTDTAGSIRIPASLCGVAGLKPTFGLISCRGVIPEAWSLDHVGIITRSVTDLPLLLAAATGGRSSSMPLCASAKMAGLRIGVPGGWSSQGIVDPVAAAFAASLTLFERLGALVHMFDFPDPDELTAMTRIIMLSESAAWHLPFLKDSPELYGHDVRVRLEFGAELSATEYINANRMRARLCSDLRRIWSDVDLVVSPTTPITAPLIGASSAVAASLGRFTAAANLLGWPALTMPCGFDGSGLPVGLQLMGAPFSDNGMLQVAAMLEAAMDHIYVSPPMA